MSVLHRAGYPWVDLRPQIVAETDRGRAVMWISWSGTLQTFATLDGELVRIRQPGHLSAHAGDGLPLLVAKPFFATACGCGDAMGYRSTPPLAVATAKHADEVAPLVDDAMQRARQLAAAGFNLDQVPSGHPPGPCGAMYCPEIRPGAARLG